MDMDEWPEERIDAVRRPRGLGLGLGLVLVLGLGLGLGLDRCGEETESGVERLLPCGS